MLSAERIHARASAPAPARDLPCGTSGGSVQPPQDDSADGWVVVGWCVERSGRVNTGLWLVHCC
jgi:hypothetical protein